MQYEREQLVLDIVTSDAAMKLYSTGHITAKDLIEHHKSFLDRQQAVNKALKAGVKLEDLMPYIKNNNLFDIVTSDGAILLYKLGIAKVPERHL